MNDNIQMDSMIAGSMRLGAFNIIQVYQYFTIYRQYFLLKFE
jgi:hypothetical protein